jgi:hypothetical protein
MLKCGYSLFRIRIHLFRLQIQHFRLNTDPVPVPYPYPGFRWTKIKKKITAENKIWFFGIKNCNLLIPKTPERTSKLQENPSALKREYPALQNMKFLNFFLFLWVIFALHRPDWIRIRIRNTARLLTVRVHFILSKKIGSSLGCDQAEKFPYILHTDCCKQAWTQQLCAGWNSSII